MQTVEEKRAYNRSRYQANRVQLLEQAKKYGKENRVKRKAYEVRVREEVLESYGHLCECCGEGRSEFLAIDHRNGNGNVMRKGRVNGHPARGGIGMYLWLRKNGYPSDFRLLCHNCNMSSAMYGYCPHKY
jgi:hypothetical protein